MFLGKLLSAKTNNLVHELKPEMERFVRIEGIPVKKDFALSKDSLQVYKNCEGDIAALQEGCYTLAQNKSGEIIESSVYTDPLGRFYSYRAVSDANGKVKLLSQNISSNRVDGNLILTEENGKIVEKTDSPLEFLKSEAAANAYKNIV